jgi:DNA-binding transcriptional LysR family regulator
MNLRYEPRLKVLWLEHFLALCQEVDILQASQKLGVSRQTLKRSLHLLEQTVGLQLLQRQGGAFHLTAEGRAFLAEAQALVTQLQTLPTTLQNASVGVLQGTVTVGWRSFGNALYLSAALVSFMARWPAVYVRVRKHYDANVLEMLLQTGQLDVAILDYMPRDQNLVVCSGNRSPYLIVSVPQQVRHWSAFSYVESEPFYPDYLPPTWDEERFPRQFQEADVNNHISILKLLKPGVATFVPQCMVQQYLDNGVLAMVAQPPEEVFKQIYLCLSPAAKKQLPVQTLLEHLRAELSNFSSAQAFIPNN